jgi:hypothetical protein
LHSVYVPDHMGHYKRQIIEDDDRELEKSNRAFRASHCIMPIKIKVHQPDGSTVIQHVDADMRKDKRR